MPGVNHYGKSRVLGMIEPLVLIPSMMCDARVFYAQLASLSADIPINLPRSLVVSGWKSLPRKS